MYDNLLLNCLIRNCQILKLIEETKSNILQMTVFCVISILIWRFEETCCLLLQDRRISGLTYFRTLYKNPEDHHISNNHSEKPRTQEFCFNAELITADLPSSSAAGVQPSFNAGLGAAGRAVTSVAMQQYSCERVCSVCDRVPLWVVHLVYRIVVRIFRNAVLTVVLNTLWKIQSVVSLTDDRYHNNLRQFPVFPCSYSVPRSLNFTNGDW
jgi:hypothetical protein